MIDFIEERFQIHVHGPAFPVPLVAPRLKHRIVCGASGAEAIAGFASPVIAAGCYGLG
jgi:hypothetical protein